MNIPEYVMNIIEKLNTVPNTTTLIVGGAVRDAIMGIEPHDYDLVTNVPMDTIEKMFNTVDIGKNKDFGIVVIKEPGEDAIEVAQFREDGNDRNDSTNVKFL